MALPKKVKQCQTSECLPIIGRQSNYDRCGVYTADHSSIRAANARRYRLYAARRTRAYTSIRANTNQASRACCCWRNRLANFKGSTIIPVDWAGVGAAKSSASWCRCRQPDSVSPCNKSRNMWQAFAGTSTDSGATVCRGPATSPIQRFAHPIWPRVLTGLSTQTSWRQSARRLAAGWHVVAKKGKAGLSY